MTGQIQSARWYFERLQPSDTLVAVEPDGTRHTVPHGDLRTAGGVRLLNRMTEALSSMAAPAACVDPMCACRGGPCAECEEGDAPLVVKTAPPRIWLQVSDDAEHNNKPFPASPHGDEVTWCQDQVLDCGVEYVRADLANVQPKGTEPELDALLQRFERQAQRFGELWERCQGKGWPEAESAEFTKIRDERLPALKQQIRAVVQAPAVGAVPITEQEIRDNARNFANSNEYEKGRWVGSHFEADRLVMFARALLSRGEAQPPVQGGQP